MTLRQLRLKAVWLIVLPFFALSRPSSGLLLGGGALAVLGLCIRGWSAGTVHKDEELTTTGPYAYTRNPLYFGSFFIGGGLSVAGGHLLWPTIFLLFYLGVYTRTMAREAGRLTELFGERYADYASHVPAFLPRLTPYPANASRVARGFQWSQYRRNREWEAALGAVAAFGILLAKVIWAS